MRFAKKSTPRARFLRRHATRHENILWECLRAGRLCGEKWRRQHPVGFYFLDFACPFLFLGVELDGSQHFEPRKAMEDRVRDQWFADEGWMILRFRNEEVEHSLPSVLGAIVSAMRLRGAPV